MARRRPLMWYSKAGLELRAPSSVEGALVRAILRVPGLSGVGCFDTLARGLRCFSIVTPWLVGASTPAGRCGSAPRGGAACPGWDADRQVKLVKCIGEVKW